MVLRKHIQMRKNKLSLSVFQAEEDGKVFLSIDKDFVSRRIKGPLFTEQELADILWLIEDYNEWESKGIPRTPANEHSTNSPPAYDTKLAQSEIRDAISAVTTNIVANSTKNGPHESTPRITILPTMPEYTFLHTCKWCGSHAPSFPLGPTGGRIRICSHCNHAYD